MPSKAYNPKTGETRTVSKPKPTTPPGTNSFGRTYEEQTAWEKAQKAKKIGSNDRNPIADFIGGLFKGAPKNTYAPGKPSPKVGPSKKVTPKQAAVKKKAASYKIPASPTH